MSTNTLAKDIKPITIEQEMKNSYLDYAMSVIVSRALPDIRDGLKPVHRRILYAMKEGGYDWSKPFRKSARIVGDVMGKLHPHGDGAIYDALVRMAQDFSMRLPLIDGQGNFGSMDGDPPAAMRYTEARLAKAAEALLADIEKNTVQFQSNYDDSEQEPTVLPAQYPNLLVNGAGGIAVGMATNIPPHNLGEVIDGCLAYLENPEIEVEDLMQIIPGPDFPTGGIILGRSGIYGAYKVGRGSIVLRGKAAIEEIRKDRQAIIITEIPYQVNKARMIEKIADIVRDKTVEGISDIRDESDRHGVRVVVEIKRDAVPEVVLNQLYKFTPLQTSFGANMLALNGGRPDVHDLKQFIEAFAEFREEVITKRTIYDLGKARERAHILLGLAIAVANIDEMIKIIRAAKDPQIAKQQIMEKAWNADDIRPLLKLIDSTDEGGAKEYKLSEAQAKAILELRLQRLTAMERDKIDDELKGLVKDIENYLAILGDRTKLLDVMRGELQSLKDRFATPRRTQIEDAEFEENIESLIQSEDMVVTVTQNGYIKRVSVALYRAQRRGGKGRTGMSTREEDLVDRIFVANTHSPVLFFTSNGRVYRFKVYQLPEGTPQSRGKAIVNLLPDAKDARISAVMIMPEDEEKWAEMSIAFATSKGSVRRNALSDFTNIRANGKIAMKLDDDEQLISVRHCTDEEDILLSTRQGKCIRFHSHEVREFASRTSTGVRGIKLAKDDHVINMSILRHVDATVEERDAYLKWASAKRRAAQIESGIEGDEGEETNESFADVEKAALSVMSQARLEELEAKEEFLLAMSSKGYGKRSSAYEYRTTGRGGSGVANMELTKKNGEIVSTFRVMDDDHIVLITDGGQLIRCPVKGIRIAGRRTQGVIVFKVPEEEEVVAVARLAEPEDEEGDEAETATEMAGDIDGTPSHLDK